MATLSITAKNVALNALLTEIQTGGGTAAIRLINIAASPDYTVIDFPLGVPEYTVSNGEMYSANSLIGTCVATAAARDCQARLVSRGGVILGNIQVGHQWGSYGGFVPDIQLMGIGDFVSGYKYEINEHRIGLLQGI